MNLKSAPRLVRVAVAFLAMVEKRAMSENNLLKSCASHRLVTVFVLVFLALGLISSADAQTETILHNFSGAGGEYPGAGLLLDATGKFYGVTFEGGNPNYCKPYGCGVVYRLSPLNGRWQETVLRDLPNYADGSFGTLVSDPGGNLYGVTISGGSSVTCPIGQTTGCGTVFELSPTATGQWKRTLLYAFTGGTDGGLPYAGLTIDASGNLYGTASGGVAHAVVFKLSPHFGTWTETVIYNFTCGTDGCGTRSPLVFDKAGNLYGTDYSSHPGYGVVFELSPRSGGRWTFKVLHTFTLGNGDGIEPSGPVTFDSTGNLYGTTSRGGGTVGCINTGCGTAFKLSPNSDGTWTETILHSFIGGDDGDEPVFGVTPDALGNLYGATYIGGPDNLGTVFELSPNSDGAWTEKILHSFTGAPNDGANPFLGVLIFDDAGNIYGTAENGGSFGTGAVYEITP